MVVQDVLLQSTFPELLPAGASGGSLPRAMAARSARTSSREEESRSTDEEERLTKRCIGWHRANNWETLFEREKAENENIYRPRQ